MDQTYLSTILQAYKKTHLVPSLASATLRRCSNNIVNIYSTWKMPDVIRAESTCFSREFVLLYENDNPRVLSSSIPSDTSSISLQVFAKSGDKYAVFRKNKNDGVFLEIWDSKKKESTFDLTESKEHGKIQDSGTFASFEWSSDEQYLLYVADAPQKKNESYFKNFFCNKSEEQTEEKSTDDKTKGEEFLYKESWGEGNTNSHHTVLCIFDVLNGKVEVVNMDEKFPNVSVAQAAWGPGNEHIVFTGFQEYPYRLGIIYCSNRRSAIFSYSLKTKTIERLTAEDDVHVEYPIFSPDFETFVFLQNKANGPHRSCQKLMKCFWKTKQIETVVDIVDDISKDGFYGVYSGGLLKWWSCDSRYLFFNSLHRSHEKMFYVNLITSEVKLLPFGNNESSCFVMDVKDSYILACSSSCNKAPFLMVGQFSSLNDKIEIKWFVVEPSFQFDDVCWETHTLQPAVLNKEYPNLDYDIICIHPKERRNGGLIIWPHGGPHTTFITSYCALSVAFVNLGYIVCKVNYRGSTGYGENSIKSLPGNIGSQDVSDVVNAIDFMKQRPDLGIKQIFGFGGSHGGFLISHLLGQFPDLLKAAVIRNPVTDLSSVFDISDIPDWAWIEAGLSATFDQSSTSNPLCLKKLFEISPIKHIKNVISPTLLCLGKVDLRVPSSQGLKFHRHLKAQNVPTNVFYYDDNHALSKVVTSSEFFVHITSWFKTYSDV